LLSHSVFTAVTQHIDYQSTGKTFWEGALPWTYRKRNIWSQSMVVSMGHL